MKSIRSRTWHESRGLHSIGFHRCCKCKKVLPLKRDYFHFKKASPTGFTDQCRSCKKIYNKEYNLKNNEVLIEKKKVYFQKVKKERYAYEKKRRQEDPDYKMKKYLRSRLWDILVRKKNLKSFGGALKILGCSVEEFWQHLEKQFQPGMTRKNYGAWHVDHIKPCASFDFTDPKQVKECFHYTNLQPLWAKDNFSKGAKHES